MKVNVKNKNKANNLFIIMGRSGSGKSLFVSIANSLTDKNTNVLKKYTIRPPRIDEKAEESNDHFFITLSEYERLKNTTESYTYVYGNDKKLIEKSKILDSIQNYKNTLIIIGNLSTMNQLKTDFSNLCNVYSVWISAEKKSVFQRLIDHNYTPSSMQERIDNCGELWDFNPENTMDFIISNTNSISEFEKQIKDFIKNHFN